MKSFVLSIAALLLWFSVLAQTSYQQTEAELRSLFGRIKNEEEDGRRLQTNDSIRMLVKGFAESDSVFSRDLEGIRFLGQVTSPDSSIKILSWNLPLENYYGKYFVFIIRKGENGERNSIFPLEAPYSVKAVTADSVISVFHWYGALYYNIRTYTNKGQKCWIILGLDYGDPVATRKIIDVLSFDEAGQPVFGKKWFETPRGMKYRVVFQFASRGMMTLRFSSDTSIVFDHLVPIASESNDKRVYYGPDYSYDAYILKDGIWKFTLNVDARNRE